MKGEFDNILQWPFEHEVTIIITRLLVKIVILLFLILLAD